MEADVLAHGLEPCRQCHKPVPGPLGLFRRELFHLSHCPHCGIHNPHPLEAREAQHTLRTALFGTAVLVASLAFLLCAPVEGMIG